jgi:flagellar biosynthesis protein FliQ
MADVEMTTEQGVPPSGEEVTWSEGQDKPFGPVAAAFLAAGIGVAILGLVTTIAEASASFADKLAWSDAVGPLSGKTIVAVGTWVVSWIVLHIALRKRDPSPGPVFAATGILLTAGFLGTFPTFFDKFAK